MATISQINIDGINYKVKDKRLKTEEEKQNIIIDPFKNGESTYGNKSVSIGYDNVAEGEGSVALGIGTKATENYQTVIGKYNSDDNQSAFIIGNGTDNDNRSQLFNIYQNGKVTTRGSANQLAGASFVTILNNINDSRAAEASANRWGDGFGIADNTETVRSYFRHADLTEGQGLQIETRRYNTDAKDSFAYNGIRLLLKKDGTPVVNVSYPVGWRTTLGLNNASNTIANTGGTAAWRKIIFNSDGLINGNLIKIEYIAIPAESAFQIGSGGSFIVKKSGNVVTMYMFKLQNKKAITNTQGSYRLGTISNAAYRPSTPVYGSIASRSFTGGMLTTQYGYIKIDIDGAITFENEGYTLAAKKSLSATITYVV